MNCKHKIQLLTAYAEGWSQWGKSCNRRELLSLSKLLVAAAGVCKVVLRVPCQGRGPCSAHTFKGKPVTSGSRRQLLWTRVLPRPAGTDARTLATGSSCPAPPCPPAEWLPPSVTCLSLPPSCLSYVRLQSCALGRVRVTAAFDQANIWEARHFKNADW